MGNSGAGWLLSLILPSPKEKVRRVSPSSQNRGLNPLSPRGERSPPVRSSAFIYPNGTASAEERKSSPSLTLSRLQKFNTDQRSGRRTPATN